MSVLDEIAAEVVSLDAFSHLSRAQVAVAPLQTLPHSEVYRVKVPAPPTKMILKRAGPADLAGLAARERRFYRDIAPLLPGSLIPQPLAVREQELSGWLLIPDLSGTHLSIVGRPTYQQCHAFVEALATLHALTELNPVVRERWGSDAADSPVATMEQRLALFALALGPFVAMLGDRVDRNDEKFLLSLKDLQQEPLPPATSLVHGDAHFANALFTEVPKACLIDWGMPMLAFGEIDLAHALALNLPRDVANDWEGDLHLAYLDQLARCGSPLDELNFRERYRWGVLYAFVNPVVWWATGVPESVWWPALLNLMDAARDLPPVS